MYIKYLLWLTLSLLTIALVSACGDTTSNLAPTYESVSTSTYKMEYIPITAAAEGKSTYKLRLTNKTSGAVVIGKTITLNPTMTMTSMNHSTPAETVTDNGDGTYSGTIYYVMASVAADGSSMGTWNLEFTVDGEKGTFHPAVAMAMGKVVKLKGFNDKIASMTGSISRTYQIFNDGIAGNSVKFFITAVDDAAMMTFPAVSNGSSLHDATGTPWTVAGMTVEASTDNGATWNSLTDDGGGHWSVGGLSGLASGGTIKLRVILNGEQKTTDGAAVIAGTNDAATFTVAAGM